MKLYIEPSNPTVMLDKETGEPVGDTGLSGRGPDGGASFNADLAAEFVRRWNAVEDAAP